jgi:hypothetical protein
VAISVMNWVWTHSRSRHGTRLVLLAIADCASGDGGDAWPSIAELKRKSALGERAVQTAIAELVTLGELRVDYNGGPRGCNRYRVIMGHTPAESAPPQNLRGSTGRKAKSRQARVQDPAESAPPQISQEPPQNLHPTPAESAPVTVLEPKANQPQKTSSSSVARATRIPDDFEVTSEMADWARREVPALIDAGHGKRETEKFRNYWQAKSGRDATKHDWVATWRNWLLKADDDLGRQPQQRQTRQQETDDQFARAMQRIAAREEAANDPQGNGIARPLHQVSLPRAAD